jgi:uncharacterized protein
MEELVTISNRLLATVNTTFKRSLIDTIDWSLQLIEIRGSRGVGKTTMLLQKAKEIKERGHTVLYASLDTPYFFNHDLFQFADTFTKFGGEYLFLDEVHRYPSKHKDSDWSLEIKNIVDAFPTLKIIYSGSSILHLYKGKGDLSRRKASYLLNGLSFHEYLEMNTIISTPTYSLEELLSNHEKIASSLIQDFKPLLHFKDYLKFGYYPFYTGNEAVYYQQLQGVINLIIDTDLPYLTPISHTAKEQLKRLLGTIASTVPYVPNMNKLAELIHVTDHRTLIKYLQLLDEAQILNLARSNAKGNKILQKPDKILIDNTNLMYALGMTNTDTGTIRETFFYNQLSYKENITYSSKADFIINATYLFEIGGANKGKKQIKGESNAYILKDNIEVGFGNVLPLWLMGLLY